ncbi:ankyrin repeat domain-containing protein [Marimonas arenosa]|uniref:Ankyrin repeat domain-containing protein n=1 Tax=Marimonas arenosa TaxID=1795305 RepID=A0AAE4B873_9RHOB|nr:ankyrin repeat domain-containing protein [Marimonas arenosa]MDQ2092301.1 ankyrin repeat domain-containing protein [Marimonas arenosa]
MDVKNRFMNFCVTGTIWAGFAALVYLVNAPIGHAGELHRAAKSGDLKKLSTLIEAGAEIDETDGENETALHKAAKGNHAEAVALLLEAGADPYISGQSAFGSTGTPLHAAAKMGRIQALQVLLEAGIDPNLNDPGAGPPLHYAVLYRRRAAVDLLESYGAGPVSAASVANRLALADPEEGKEVANTCRLCHLFQRGDDGRPRAGPTLWNILGRPKGSVVDYAYSDAMRAAGGVWTYDDLNSYVVNPKGFVPGTKMQTVQGISSPERRAALIRFLRELSDAPKALPE